MQRVITGATGLIGKRLVEHWLSQQHGITVVGRSKQHIQSLFGERVQAVSWEDLKPDIFQSAEVVVNLAGANVSGKPWNEGYKREILNSRLDTTKKIAHLMAEMGSAAPPLFNASAIGVYGLQAQLPDQLPARLDESTPIDFESATDFLSAIGRRWEKAAESAITSGVRVVFLRFAVVLAKEGGALPQFVKSFKFYLGGPMGTGQQPFSWISIDDVLHAIDFLLTKPEVAGPFNIVAPECVSQAVFAETLARVLDKPQGLKLPAFALKIMLGKEMAHELLLEGQNVYPQRLLDSGFQFAYPDIESALNRILR